jgi:hypothetical protein
MKKAIRITKMALATLKAFVEYQLFHRKNEDKL